MSVLIRGMEMPKNCDECVMRYVDHYGYIMCELTHQLVKSGAKDRYDNCPLIELPPHGRLIDGDKFYKVMCSHWVLSLGEAYKRLEEFLKKPVIEAEGSET